MSALFTDDRLPLRYLQSLMCRLTTGHSPRQAALTFDGFALSWLWKLDSDSLSSYWLPSTDLNSLSLLQQSIPTDNMVGSKCNLKMYVQNLEYPFPLQIRGPKPRFWLKV